MKFGAKSIAKLKIRCYKQGCFCVSNGNYIEKKLVNVSRKLFRTKSSTSSVLKKIILNIYFKIYVYDMKFSRYSFSKNNLNVFCFFLPKTILPTLMTSFLIRAPVLSIFKYNLNDFLNLLFALMFSTIWFAGTLETLITTTDRTTIIGITRLTKDPPTEVPGETGPISRPPRETRSYTTTHATTSARLSMTTSAWVVEVTWEVPKTTEVKMT